MTWNHWVNSMSPFIAGLMDVGVADTTVMNVYFNIPRTWRAAGYGEGRQWGCCALCGIRLDFEHKISLGGGLKEGCRLAPTMFLNPWDGYNSSPIIRLNPSRW